MESSLAPARDTASTITCRRKWLVLCEVAGKAYLDGVLLGHQEDQLAAVTHDTAGLHLLTVVASVHHDGAGQTLNDRALGLSEALLGPTVVWRNV